MEEHELWRQNNKIVSCKKGKFDTTLFHGQLADTRLYHALHGRIIGNSFHTTLSICTASRDAAKTLPITDQDHHQRTPENVGKKKQGHFILGQTVPCKSATCLLSRLCHVTSSEINGQLLQITDSLFLLKLIGKMTHTISHSLKGPWIRILCTLLMVVGPLSVSGNGHTIKKQWQLMVEAEHGRHLCRYCIIRVYCIYL